MLFILGPENHTTIIIKPYFLERVAYLIRDITLILGFSNQGTLSLSFFLFPLFMNVLRPRGQSGCSSSEMPSTHHQHSPQLSGSM